MKKTVFIAVLIIALMLPVQAFAASDTNLKKVSNTLAEMMAGTTEDTTSFKAMTVSILTKTNNVNLKAGRDFDLRVNGDIQNAHTVSTYSSQYDISKWKATDVISITLKSGGNYNASDVEAGYFAFNRALGNGSYYHQATWYIGALSDQQKNDFFRDPILGEVAITEIPATMVQALRGGGILSVALIVFAILLGVGLVPRLKSWFFH